MEELIETGKVVNTHGVNGEVRVQSWADNPNIMLGFDHVYIEGRRFDIAHARINKSNLLYKFYDVDNLNKAELLRNKIVYAERSQFKLKKGTYFIKDLLNLNVVDVDTGRSYGSLVNVLQTGANDVYELKDETGKVRMIPAIKDCIIETNITERYMKIRPLPGLFEEDNAPEEKASEAAASEETVSE